MKINFQNIKSKNEFITFNTESFPERASLNEQLINFRYFNQLNQGELLSQNVIATDDAGKIIGQALYHPAAYYFQNEKREMEWGFDLFVRQDKRQDSVGLHLFDFIKENKKNPIFATGVGEKALKIEKFYGYHVIGHLKKFYKIVNPFFLLTGILRKKNIKTEQFPDFIKGNKKFKKITSENLWDCEQAYNDDLLEFERNEHFLKWRFYSANFQYALYKLDNNQADITCPVYFVVRTVKIKRITILVLVDYRFNVNHPEKLSDIIKATHQIAQKLFLPIVVAGSAHKVSDQVLAASQYKITGRDRPIICNKKEYKDFKDNIKNREFLFCTFADSDGEYLM